MPTDITARQRFANCFSGYLKMGMHPALPQGDLGKPWTNEAFADKAGLDRKSIGNWKTGRNLPSDQNLLLIEQIFFGADNTHLPAKSELRDLHRLAALELKHAQFAGTLLVNQASELPVVVSDSIIEIGSYYSSNNSQKTLAKMIKIEGVGLHSGVLCRVTLLPAPANTGHFFKLLDECGATIAGGTASISALRASKFTSKLVYDGHEVGCIAHLLAALKMCDIDNCVIEVFGPEIPVLDGSAAPFAQSILKAGTIDLFAKRSVFTLSKTLLIEDGDTHLEFLPSAGLQVHVSVDFPDTIIGKQSAEYFEFRDDLLHDFSIARPIAFINETERLVRDGLILGGSLANSIVIASDNWTLLNLDGFRCENELARHKIIDVIGDLVCLSFSINIRVVAYRSRHALIVEALKKLYETSSHWIQE